MCFYTVSCVQVLPQVIGKCTAGLAFREQLCDLHLKVVSGHPQLSVSILPLLPHLKSGVAIRSSLSRGLRAIFECFSPSDIEHAASHGSEKQHEVIQRSLCPRNG
jgi:hypothetical protein